MRSLDHDVLGGVGDELRVLSQPVLGTIRQPPTIDSLFDTLRLPLLRLSGHALLHGRRCTLQLLSIFHLSKSCLQSIALSILYRITLNRRLCRLFINGLIRQLRCAQLRRCRRRLVLVGVEAIFWSDLHCYFLCVPSLPWLATARTALLYCCGLKPLILAASFGVKLCSLRSYFTPR